MKTHLVIAAAALSAQALTFNGHAAAPTKPIELSFSHHETTASYFRNHGLVPWMKSIEEATKGRVKIVEYPAQTLAKQTAAWQATTTSPTWRTASILSRRPLTDVITLLLPIPSGEVGSGVLYQIYAKFPEIQNEYRNVKMLTPHIAGPYFLQTVKKQVKTLEDLKGLKVRAIAGPPTASMKLLGATPLLIPIPDIYLALQKGVLDGAATTFNAALEWRYYELIKQHVCTAVQRREFRS
jgi:TRAP-type C4-dicarboxylate transport system substrate-binding protein